MIGKHDWLAHCGSCDATDAYMHVSINPDADNYLARANCSKCGTRIAGTIDNDTMERIAATGALPSTDDITVMA